MSEEIKTFNLDKYGSKVNEELEQLYKKYRGKIYELTKEFANECVDYNIEFTSAYGLFLSFMMQGLSGAYFERQVEDLPKVHINCQ